MQCKTFFLNIFLCFDVFHLEIQKRRCTMWVLVCQNLGQGPRTRCNGGKSLMAYAPYGATGLSKYYTHDNYTMVNTLCFTCFLEITTNKRQRDFSSAFLTRLSKTMTPLSRVRLFLRNWPALSDSKTSGNALSCSSWTLILISPSLKAWKWPFLSATGLIIKPVLWASCG